MNFKLIPKVLSGLSSVLRQKHCFSGVTTYAACNRCQSTRLGNFPVILTGCNRRFSTDTKTIGDDQPIEKGEDTSSISTDVGKNSTPFPEYPAVVEPSQQVLDSLSAEDQRKLKILAMEREVFHQSGYPVPRYMTDRQWLDILQLESRSQRLKLFRFLLIRENHHIREKAKKEENRLLRLSKPPPSRHDEENKDGPLEYGLNKNTIFLMLRQLSMNVQYNHWQCQAIKFGQSIVVDLGYDQYMSKPECANCADQIKDMYSVNKFNKDPFHFHLCNAIPGNQTYELLQSYLSNLHDHTNMMSVSTESYLDLFPREKLVYLTPHCKESLKRYDHDSVYIIGGIVDKTIMQPVSMAKAKREGIAMARLPLDSYLQFRASGGKSLTLDQMMKIMLDIKNTGDWNTALRHVPRRKLKVPGEDGYVERSPKSAFRARHYSSNKRYNYD